MRQSLHFLFSTVMLPLPVHVSGKEGLQTKTTGFQLQFLLRQACSINSKCVLSFDHEVSGSNTCKPRTCSYTRQQWNLYKTALDVIHRHVSRSSGDGRPSCHSMQCGQSCDEPCWLHIEVMPLSKWNVC